MATIYASLFFQCEPELSNQLELGRYRPGLLLSERFFWAEIRQRVTRLLANPLPKSGSHRVLLTPAAVLHGVNTGG